MLRVISHFLSTVIITFDAMQKSDGHLMQQLDNLGKLTDDLVSKCGATVDDSITEPSEHVSVAGNVIRMGPYSITADALRDSILSMGVIAFEAFESLDQREKNSVMRAMSVLYLHALNGIMRIKAERNLYDQVLETLPPYTPLGVVEVSAVDFVQIVRRHKPRILHSFSQQMLTEITDQQQQLVQVVSRQTRVKEALEKVKSGNFNKVWSPVDGPEFSSLRMFCSGLASAMPTTSRVEADFSYINYRKDEFCSAMSDFALEGVLFARQKKDIERLIDVLFRE